MISALRHLFFIIGLSLTSLPAQARDDLEKVSLQLDWVYQYEYAGFIAAKEKGYYSEVGLDVELKEYHSGIDIIDEVMSHRVNYGINNTSIIINKTGVVPIALLATYMQHSPLIFVSSVDITNSHDFLGKRIMGTSDELKHRVFWIQYANVTRYATAALSFWTLIILRKSMTDGGIKWVIRY